MPPTGSTVVAVRKQIVAQLQAAAGLTGVQITYAFPGVDRQAQESIFTAFATIDHTVPTMKAGRKTRDEEYVQQLIIEVHGHGDSQETVDTRAWALLAEVENVFADDPNLGIPDTVLWATIQSATDVGGSIDRGHACRIEVDIAVRARLT